MKRFWDWYERHYVLNVTIAAALFALQVVHLVWLTLDPLWAKVFGDPLIVVDKPYSWPLLLVDYTEIPALIMVSLVYINELRRGFALKPGRDIPDATAIGRTQRRQLAIGGGEKPAFACNHRRGQFSGSGPPGELAVLEPQRVHRASRCDEDERAIADERTFGGQIGAPSLAAVVAAEGGDESREIGRDDRVSGDDGTDGRRSGQFDGPRDQ